MLGLIEAGRPVTEIADRLGVSDQTIYNWRNQDEIDCGLRVGISTSESVELAAARKRIGELETELAVTKRANELLKAQSNPKALGGLRPACERGPLDRVRVSRRRRIGIGVLHVAASQAVAPRCASDARRGHRRGACR